MHEMSIAMELLQQLERLALEHRATRIEEVTLRAGVMRGIVPEAMQFAFTAAAQGTCAQGAALHLEFEQVKARCRQCGQHFSPGMDSFLCSRCNQADVEIVQGNDLVIRSVLIQEQDNKHGED